MKKQIITISGLPGSGKSSAAKSIAQALSYRHFSSGDFMRNIALDMGISLNELGKIAESDQGQIDFRIDEEIRKTSQDEKLVIDSRLAFHWIPQSFKVFLDLPMEVSQDRIWNNLKNNPLREKSEQVTDKNKLLGNIQERVASERKRYMELYGVDYTQKENFDLVVDTEKNNIEETEKCILEMYQKWLNKND